MGRRKGYHREYYEENKEEICAARRERYHADPEHKRYVLENAKRRYLERREREVQRFGDGFIAGWMPIVAEVPMLDGTYKKRRLYRIGALVKAVGKTYGTVEKWHKKGYMPPTPYVSRNGQRFYTEAMIDVVVDAFLMAQGENISKLNSKAFCSVIVSKWRKLGIPI